MKPRRDKACDVRHIHHEKSAGFIRDFAQFCKVDRTRICGCACNDHLGFVHKGKAAHFIIVDHFRFRIYTIGNEVIILAGHVHGAAVRQVSAMGQIHAKHGVSIVQERKINGKVRLRAGMRLHICVFCAKQPACAFTSQVFYDVHALTAAVIPFAGIAFGIFVGQMAAHRCHHGLRNEVFGSDQLQMVALALEFQLHCFGNLRIRCANQVKLNHNALPFF